MRSDEILKKTEEGMREGNKILIQELVRDLEEKGISPVIAVDGEVKNLKLIDGKELKNFETELKKSGLEKSDFCLLEEDKTTQKSLHVFVVQKKSGKIKKYKNSRWAIDFHQDLERKFFTV